MTKAARKFSVPVQEISSQQRAAIEANLRNRAEQLRAMNNQANRAAVAEVEITHADEVDVASAQETAETARMRADAMRLEMLRVNDALERIRTGRFGTCEECDSAIPVKRLEIRPEARLCIDCQSEEERHFGRPTINRGEMAYAS